MTGRRSRRRTTCFAFDRKGFFPVKRQPRVCVFLVSGVRSDAAIAPHRLDALFSGSVFFIDGAVTDDRSRAIGACAPMAIGLAP
jgi:hypothetical protein